MKKLILIASTVVLCAACEQRVESPTAQPAEKSVEKNTTVIAPPAKTEEKSSTTTTTNAPGTSSSSTTTTNGQ